MQKKLLAAAVAGALGMPAVALAQNATVNVYGKMYLEYGFTTQGTNAAGTINRVNPDAFQSPGSAIGFRGEEKLGGNMSAWFQCESTADMRGQSLDGWCGRNSAVGFKGGFGNLFFGNWDTPFKRARITTGSQETGHFGTSGLLTGHSTTTADGAQPQLFARRQNNSINYDTPNFGGFTLSASTTTVNASTNKAQALAADKARVWSVAGIYSNGPLNASVAYEKHAKFYSPIATVSGDEEGWLVGVSYNIMGRFNVGGMYTQQKWEPGVGLEGKVKAWQIGVDANIAGPHSVLAAYTVADDVKGSAVAAVAGGLRPGAGPDTGAKMAQIRYKYAFSKRTSAAVGYNQVKNDRNAGYNINGIGGNGGAGGGNGLGGKHKTVAFTVEHNF